jgi:hypothetical protein
MSFFEKEDYDRLHELAFAPGYPGYKPEVREIPNGDGVVDQDKKYAHIATKYLDKQPDRDLYRYLKKAHDLAVAAADLAKIPKAFMPKIEFGALRILDYPAGAVSARHTDFDLFTLMVYRDKPALFKGHDVEVSETLRKIQLLNPQAHLGEIAELLGLGAATPHETLASPDWSGSIVYFAIPDHAAVLPTGQTVGDWIAERVARSRTPYKPTT